MIITINNPIELLYTTGTCAGLLCIRGILICIESEMCNEKGVGVMAIESDKLDQEQKSVEDSV